MSVPSRFQNFYKSLFRQSPLQPMRRCLNFDDKGKAEENVFFRKEQARLLDKLRKALNLAPSTAQEATKSNPEGAKEGNEKKES